MKNVIHFIQKSLLFLTIIVVMSGASFAYANDLDEVLSSDLDRLFEIRSLAQQDSSQGIVALHEFQTEVLEKSKNQQLVLEFYKQAYAIYVDANQIENSDKSLAKMKQLAIELGDKDQVLVATLIDTSKLIFSGQTTAALQKLNQLAPQINASKNREVHFYYNLSMASVQDTLGQFDSALKYYLEALTLSDFQPRRKNESRIRILSWISIFYYNNKDLKKALEFNQEALAIAKKINAKQSTIANLMMSNGFFLIAMGEKKDALKHYTDALKLARSAKSLQLELTILININDYYLKEGKYALSKNYAEQTLALAQKLQDKSNEAIAKVNLGLTFAYMGDVKKGVALVEEAIQFHEASASPISLELTLGELADMYEKIGMTAKALETYKARQKISDEIFNSTRAKAVSDLQEQFNSEQRTSQIALLEKENNLQSSKIQNFRLQVIAIILAASLVIVIGIMIFLLYLKLKKTNIKLNEANILLEFHSMRDPLTGLYNRRSFLNLMKEREVSSKAKRKTDSEHPDTIILIDLDFFKQINDRFGHSAGDAVLLEVAQRLSDEVRDTDMVIRWGGEEFLIYSRQSSFADISILAQRILNSIAKLPVVFKEENIFISATAGFISIPYSNIPSDVCNWEKAMHIADMALYLGKINGRNRAYGVGDLLVSYEVALPVISTDISTAVKNNMLDLVEILGPAPTHI